MIDIVTDDGIARWRPYRVKVAALASLLFGGETHHEAMVREVYGMKGPEWDRLIVRAVESALRDATVFEAVLNAIRGERKKVTKAVLLLWLQTFEDDAPREPDQPLN